MSKPAEQYYQDRAKDFGIDTVPPILSGRPCILWQSPDEHGVVTYSALDVLDTLTERYSVVLEQVGSFAIACSGKQLVPPGERHTEGRLQNRRHAAELFTPGEAVPTERYGRLHAVYIEAIPDVAISIAAARIAFTASPWRVAPEFEDESTFLQLTSVFKTERYTKIMQTHIITHPHEFYEPATEQHRQVLYDAHTIGDSSLDLPRYLRQIRAFPWGAEFWQDGKL